MKIPAGITNVSFTILIADDEIPERREFFYITIYSNSNFLVQSHYPYSRIPVYIQDDDCKLIFLWLCMYVYIVQSWDYLDACNLIYIIFIAFN